VFTDLRKPGLKMERIAAESAPSISSVQFQTSRSVPFLRFWAVFSLTESGYRHSVSQVSTRRESSCRAISSFSSFQHRSGRRYGSR